MDATTALMAALRALAEQQAFNDALRQRLAELEAARQDVHTEVAPDGYRDAVHR